MSEFMRGDRVMVRPESREIRRDLGEVFPATVLKVFEHEGHTTAHVEPDSTPGESLGVGVHVLVPVPEQDGEEN